VIEKELLGNELIVKKVDNKTKEKEPGKSLPGYWRSKREHIGEGWAREKATYDCRSPGTQVSGCSGVETWKC